MELTATQRIFIRIRRRLNVQDEQQAISLCLLSETDLDEAIDWAMDKLEANEEPTEAKWMNKIVELDLKAIQRSRGK